MRNIAFVIWMLCWPLVWAIGDYLAFLQGVKISLTADIIGGSINIFIWIFVGVKLYEKKT